ncbi:MAG: formylglycine-generating enzyme family protein [Gammaproteobacteria bacterium]|nr:formylglycine-generating enzyme family protein [Gammaproteobacteria bacterium]
MDKIPAMAQEEIDELIGKLDREYRAAQAPKATEIYLYPYYMDREAVSNAEYEAFCAAADYARPGHWAGSKIPERAENLPVVNISLEDAKAYARWAGKELPTAQEWEKACRGEHGLRYPWGNDWDESRVKTKDGRIRKAFEAEYEELNAVIPEQGGTIRFKTPRFSIPPHQLAFDEAEFLSYLQGSISGTADDKRKVLKSLPDYDQAKIDWLMKILREEKARNLEWIEEDKEYEATISEQRKTRYIELMEAELAESSLNALQGSELNESFCGIRDMVGDNYEMSISESGGRYIIKGGSWFCEDPEKACMAWAADSIKGGEKRLDVGFRCVKPIFSREDL